MSTFQEIGARTRMHEDQQKPGHINFCGLIGELAEAMDILEFNTARMFATFSITSATPTPLDQMRQQVNERTAFVLEQLRKDTP